MENWQDHVKDLSRRLEHDYRDRVARVGGGFSAGGNRTEVQVEALLGGHIGPMWGTSVKYARRRGLFGPVEQFVEWPEVERRVRAEVEAWLAQQEKKQGIK
jgi:hypothetical protein